MPNLYCVRADYGKYTEKFLNGDYVAIGWLSHVDLSNVVNRDDLYPLYRRAYPEDTSNVVIGQQVGQIARFLLEIKAGDFVITPDSNTEFIHYGVIENDPSYFFADGSDGCPFLHRRRIKWHKTPLQRSLFSVPFQNTIRSSLTVFNINHQNHFFEIIGKKELVRQNDLHNEHDHYTYVLKRILELDAKEFEILVTNLLTALGFEANHVGKVGDGGVDATGELNVANLAKIKIYVQAKRYQLGSTISSEVVRSLRQNIPSGAQGAFITTGDYQKKAKEVAIEQGFPRIGLINGQQLVDILVEHWEDIPIEFKEKLNLKLGLVVS